MKKKKMESTKRALWVTGPSEHPLGADVGWVEAFRRKAPSCGGAPGFRFMCTYVYGFRYSIYCLVVGYVGSCVLMPKVLFCDPNWYGIDTVSGTGHTGFSLLNRFFPGCST